MILLSFVFIVLYGCFLFGMPTQVKTWCTNEIQYGVNIL